MPPVVVLAHLALPWALRWAVGRGRPRRLVAAVRRDPVAVYGNATVALAALALLAVPLGAASGGLLPWLGPAGWPALGGAALLGAGFPWLLARLSGKRRWLARRRPGGLLRLSAYAVAEEVLWRMVALGVLLDGGLHLLLAWPLTVVGFALLHVPQRGWRAFTYQLLFGTLLTLVALVGGCAAAAVCHAVHNAWLAGTTRVRPSPVRASQPVRLPPSQQW